MSAYPTPAGVSATAGISPLEKLTSLFRRRSMAAVLDTVWVPLVSAALVALVGSVGVWMKQPWLFASLAPTILMVAANPGHETSNFRAIVVGHIAAIACAYLALLMLDATGSATLLTTRIVPLPRVWASAVALAMLAIVTPPLKAFHTPAAATALLVTLGAYRMTGRTPLALVGSVLLVAVAAEAIKRIRPRRSR